VLLAVSLAVRLRQLFLIPQGLALIEPADDDGNRTPQASPLTFGRRACDK
jgi:hypothetical protein